MGLPSQAATCTISLTTQKVETIPFSALPKDTSDLPAYVQTIREAVNTGTNF